MCRRQEVKCERELSKGKKRIVDVLKKEVQKLLGQTQLHAKHKWAFQEAEIGLIKEEIMTMWPEVRGIAAGNRFKTAPIICFLPKNTS